MFLLLESFKCCTSSLGLGNLAGDSELREGTKTPILEKLYVFFRVPGDCYCQQLFKLNILCKQNSGRHGPLAQHDTVTVLLVPVVTDAQ